MAIILLGELNADLKNSPRETSYREPFVKL
jgi:hypothetical protein